MTEEALTTTRKTVEEFNRGPFNYCSASEANWKGEKAAHVGAQELSSITICQLRYQPLNLQNKPLLNQYCDVQHKVCCAQQPLMITSMDGLRIFRADYSPKPNVHLKTVAVTGRWLLA